MDLLPLAFLLLIVLLSGAIALLADELGRKLGKKRLFLKWRFLHLRPKHTAKIGVFFSGVVVSALTIALIVLLSSDVRTWLLRGRGAIRELKVAEGQLVTLQAQGAELNRKNASLRAASASGAARLEAQKDQIARQTALLRAQKGELATLKSQARTLRNEVAAARSRAAEADALLGRNRRDLAQRQNDLAAARRSLAAVRGEIRTARVTKDTAVKEYGAILDRNLEIENRNRELENNVRKLSTDVGDLQAEQKRLTDAREAAQRALQTATDDLSTARNQLDDAERSLRDTQERLTQISSQYRLDSAFFERIGTTFKKSRETAITFRKGEEIARYRVTEGADPEKTLDAFLRAARAEAARRGARGDEGYGAADIVDHFDPALKRSVPAGEIRRSLVRQIAALPGAGVLTAYSSLNAFEGEPVSVEVALSPDPVVYKGGQSLASVRIDGRKPAAQVFREVSQFLSGKIAARAKTDGMIPRAGSEMEFGQIGAEEVLDLVDRIRRAERRVDLRAVAAAETRAGDPLRLEFQIR